MDPQIDDVRARLDAIEARVAECRAATQVALEGDPSAFEQLDAEVDAMAEDVAALKATTSSGRLGS